MASNIQPVLEEEENVQSLHSKPVQNLHDQNFQVTGPRLFNSLPRHIRDTSKATVEEFKEKLDKFLAVLPDEPKIGEMIPHICDQTSAKPSNSLIDVILYQRPGMGEAKLPLLY